MRGTVRVWRLLMATSLTLALAIGVAGCALFQEFLDETGAGERAIGLLPTEIPMADGAVVRFAVRLVEVESSTIVIAGSIETR